MFQEALVSEVVLIHMVGPHWFFPYPAEANQKSSLPLLLPS